MTAAAASIDLHSYTPEPSRTLTLRAARRRSHAVRLVRAILALGMLGIVATISGYVMMGALAATPLVAETSQDGTVRMVNPRFTGRDSAAQPYIITAEAAVRRADEEAITRLETPRMEFVAETGKPSSFVTADNGVYDTEVETLDLFGTVQFRSSSGYLFTTSHAKAYVAEGRVMGDQPINGDGPLGKVDAQMFEIWDSGARIVFKTNVEAQIYQEPTASPSLQETIPANIGAGAQEMIR